MFIHSLNTRLRLMTVCVILLIATLLAACGGSAAAPTSTPNPPTPIPPTATKIPPTNTPVSPGKTKVEVGEITSEALADNLLGDPATRKYVTVLPPGYAERDKHYPVVYVLHYYGGDAYSLASDIPRALQNVEAGSVQDMIYVFPDASNKLGGSWYMSSPVIGDYETYLTQELIEHIDSTYRTIAHRDSRGVMGCSDGGHGAMHLALTYPDMFGVVAGISGTYDFANDPLWETTRSSLKKIPEELDGVRFLPWQAQWYFAGAAATTTDPVESPFFFEVPFQMIDGEAQIVQEVAERINVSDSMHDLLDYLEQQTKLNGIMLYHGESDEYAAVELVRSFDEKLTESGVEHEYLEVKGRHCDLDYEPVLQFMSDHLVSEISAEVSEP